MSLRRLLTIVASLGITMAFANAATNAQTDKDSLNIVALLGKDFSAYEKILGAPKLIERNLDFSDTIKEPGETRYYKHPGFIRVILTKENNGEYYYDSDGKMVWKKKPTKLRRFVTDIEIQVEQSSVANLQDLLSHIGFSPAAIAKIEGWPDAGTFNFKYKDSSCHWVPDRTEPGRASLWIRVNYRKYH